MRIRILDFLFVPLVAGSWAVLNDTGIHVDARPR